MSIVSARFFIVLFFLFLQSSPVIADDLKEQRQKYLAAKKEFNAGNMKAFTALTEQLRDYPLYPYLVYQDLSRRLSRASHQELQEFIATYPRFIFIDTLRANWLRQLARRSKWQAFLDNYSPQKDKRLRCLQLQARIETGNPAYLLEDTRTLWLSGESLPSQCDKAFKLLYKSDLMTSELVWQRIGLAMENNKASLARYLGGYLNVDHKIWLQRWLVMHSNPASQIKRMNYADAEKAREIISYGIKRLAKQNINLAIRYWPLLQERYSLAPSVIDNIDLLLAVRAARKRHARAVSLLDNVKPGLSDEQVLHWRLRIALQQQNWQQLYRWTKPEPPDIDAVKYRWIYWRARALEKIGDLAEADLHYAAIANERDYYGFLAADRIDVPYQMNDYPLPQDIESKNKISRLPAVRQARELFILYGSDWRARRQWQHAVRSMTNYQKQIAAGIVAEWGWYDRAIFTMGMAKAFNDLALRFPIVFADEIEEYAGKTGLDISWVLGLIRAESAFMERVKSPAGALGLMQVMPSTGRLVAKSIGMTNFRTDDLLQARKNISIGTAYMKQVWDRFNRNYVLATASYNAGPGNVTKWSPKEGCRDADLWIELIPFNETRKYVKRVMFYASIYDRQLGLPVVPLQERMPVVSPYKRAGDSRLAPCPG